MHRTLSTVVMLSLGLYLGVAGCDGRDEERSDGAPEGGPSADSDVGGVDGDDDGRTTWTLLVEAESFELNEYWAVCPGSECEDDGSALASGGSHIITRSGHVAGARGALRQTVELPAPGELSLWTLTVSAGEGQEWSLSLGEQGPFVVGREVSGRWELAGSATADAVDVELVIQDASPNEYLASPDAVLITDDLDHDPNGR